MNIRQIDITEINENYLQSDLWANVKIGSQLNSPWKAFAFETESIGKVLVLERKLFLNYYLAYIAHPEFSNKELSRVDIKEESKLISSFSKEVRHFLNKNTIFIRYDFMYYSSRKVNEKYINSKVNFKPLKKAFDDIQPKNTVILNLEAPINDIIAGMKKKTRYNIKLSQKKNLKIINDREFEHFDDFYLLHSDTAKRDKFSIHSKTYLLNLIKEFKSNKASDIFLIAVYYNNKLISGLIIGVYKDKATYLYGASSNEHRNLMPNYAAQFMAIKICKELNIKEYDLLGIPPIAEPNHPLFGLYQFKTGFGGELIHRVGSYDAIYNKALYGTYKIIEKLRYFYYKVLKKRI